MTTKTLKMAAASAALLITASLGGQAFAQSYGDHGGQPQPAYQQGGDHGQRGGYDQRGDQGAAGAYDRDFGDRGFNDREFDQRGGRFYYGGDIRQRMERIEQWARFGARNGRLDRRDARRAFGMLDQLRQQVRWSNRDGVVSPREQMMLNGRLDQVVRFIRVHQNRIDDGRRY